MPLHFLAQTAVASLETLEPRLLLAGMEPTAYAQYMLELINLVRGDPTVGAARLSIYLNEGLAPDRISSAAKQPLAFSPFLVNAAQDRSTWMIAHNLLPAPAGAPENNASTPMPALGVPNVLAATSKLHSDLFCDTGVPGRLDRLNLMDPDFQEVGISLISHVFQGVDSVVCTQDFAFSNQLPFITGVVFQDDLVLRDYFYTPGEALGGVTVTAVQQGAGGATFTTKTFASGGYSLQVPVGTYDVQFSGGRLSVPLVRDNVLVTNLNVKVDLQVIQGDLQIPRPDLTVAGQGSLATPLYVRPGDLVSFVTLVRNIGAANAGSNFTVNTYLSDKLPNSVSDTRVDSFTLSGLAVKASNTQQRTFNAPTQEGRYYFGALVDDGNAIAESNENNNWYGAYTLIVGLPDLAPTINKISLPDVLVPGDKGSISVTVANTGSIPGTLGDTEIFASQNNMPHAPAVGDVLLATMLGGKHVVGPGASRTIKAKIAITEALTQGAWYILAYADAHNALAESNEPNNIVATPTANDLVWQFGTFTARKNAKLTIHDGQGTLVTFGLSGSGWGEVQGGSASPSVVLHETTTTTAMTLKTSGPKTSLGGLRALGTVKSVSAERADIAGDIEIAGGIGTLKFGDVAAGHTITIHSDAGINLDPRTQATITLGFVADAALNAGDEPIKSLSVIEWRGAAGPGNAITAPSMGGLTARGQKVNVKTGPAFSAGDFTPKVNLAGTVGAVKVAGSLSGQWHVLSVKSLSVGADVTGLTLTLTQAVDPKFSAMGNLTVKGWIRQSSVFSSGNLGACRAGGMWDFELFAGVDPSAPPGGLPDPATAFASQAAIKSVTVRGTVNDGSGHSTIDTNIAAYRLGSVSLRNALSCNAPPTPWGLAGHTLAGYSYKDASVSFVWKPSAGGVPGEPTGDFTVRLA